MAAIDFPASPVDGALFASPNGVMYRWMATPGIWVVQTNRAAAPGDFCAMGAPPLNNTFNVMVFSPVITGNSGGWYNASTGRYTPPAGRYAIAAAVGAWNSTVSFGLNAEIRKNGTKIGTTIVATAAAANQWVTAPITIEVDANGTDYFEVWGQALATGGSQGYFTAFPIAPPVAPVAAPTAPGDFMAAANTAMGVSTSPTLLIFPTVLTGNLGGYYNTANGRWTPPAGRYRVSAGYQFYSSSGAMGIYLIPQKNGANFGAPVLQSSAFASAANTRATAVIDFVVDMNGTDYISINGQTQTATTPSASEFSWFSAFPLQPAIIPLQSAITADFCARLPDYAGWAGNAQVGVTGGPLVLISGNGGNYFNLATARYTPPAGRHQITAAMSFAAPGGSTSVTLSLLKNGTPIQNGFQHTGAANFNGNIAIVETVDANGTDYFDWWINTSIGTNIYGLVLSASPVNPNILSTTPQSMASTANFAVRATANTSFTGPGSTNIFRAAATPVEDYDVGACWDNANGEFIAPFAGRYQFNLSMHGDPASAGQYSGPAISHLTAANAVIRNYAAPHVINTSGANSANFLGQLLNMNAGEKVRFMLANPNAIAFTVHAEDATVIAGGATLTYASGYRVT